MANQTVYPYGTGGGLPSSIGVINDLYTGGITDALSAEQGKVLNERFLQTFFTNSASADWMTGNVRNNNTIDSTYANKYILLEVSDLSQRADSIRIIRGTPPDSNYSLNVLTSTDGSIYTKVAEYGTSPGEKEVTITGKKYVALNLWDKPSTERAKEEIIVVKFVGSINDNTKETYSNPVLRVDNPDPTIWDGEDGYFYLYATGNLSSKRMYRSANLVDWESTGDAPMNDTEALKVAEAFGASTLSQDYWAPCVIKITPTTWNLYLAKPAGGIAILTSNHPTRGYVYNKFISKPSGAGEFIDAEVALDTDGKVWMFTGGNGSIYRRQMTNDGLDWAEGSSFELCAGLVQGASGNSYREKTFEGPYLYRRKGYWYLFCSSGLYAAGNYKMRVVRSQTLGGTWVDKSGNSALNGYAETVLVSNGATLTGPGHNAPIFVDSNNDTWILYHSHWSGFQSSSTRGVCLDKVEWDENGWPFINDGKPSVSHEVPSVFR